MQRLFRSLVGKTRDGESQKARKAARGRGFLANLPDSFCFRPLAMVLIWLMLLPPAGWVTGSRQFQAGATGVTCTPQAILQAGCANADLAQLESDAVSGYLAAHGLPANDSSVLYTYGRADVRNEIRAVMFAKMLDIISRQSKGSPLSAHDQNLYQWFLNLIQLNERLLYRAALDDRNSWQNNPCTWTPDPDVAAAYGLVYTKPAACNPSSLDTLFDSIPTVPTKSYFLAAALKNVYFQPFANLQGGPAALLDVTAKVAIVWGFAAV